MTKQKMKSAISAKWSLLIIGIVGIVSSSVIIYIVSGNYNFQKSPIVMESVAPGLPLRLKIPKINVDANIEYVGLTREGAMGAPKSPSGVAWFELGPRPGSKGSSVIAGHYGWKNNIPAAFDDLNKLVKGDKIYVVDDRGATTTFIVQESRTYNENSDTSTVFYSNDGKVHLNLITCVGIWSKANKSYSNRFTVFSDKEVE